MINRKIELILIIVGLAVFVLFGVSGTSMIIAHNDEAGAGLDLYESFLREAPAPEEMTEDQVIPDFEEFLVQLRTIGIIIIVLSIVAIIVGVASFVMLKNNKKPKLAGLFLLIIGVFVGLLQFAIAIIGSLVYAIAGLMATFRKPKLV